MSNEPVAWMHVQGNFEEPSSRQLDEDGIGRGWKQYPLYTNPAPDDTALLRQALGALEKMLDDAKHERVTVMHWNICVDAITALRERLEGKA